MEWISVKDKLPQIGMDFNIIYVTGKGQVSCGYCFEIDDDEENICVLVNDHITQDWQVCKFWMLLPEPPKLDQSEE